MNKNLYLCFSFQLKPNPAQVIAIQVKLLMEIPEKIWKCIERDDFVKASQLFIMARHINTGNKSNLHLNKKFLLILSFILLLL